MLDKAPGLGADELILDLEDAVLPEAKDEARELVCRALRERADWGGAHVSVRVNAPGTPWCHQDLIALAGTPVGAVVLPKAQAPGDVAFAERLLAGAEAAAGRAEPVRLQALVETAGGLALAREIASASARVDALILGYADLAASLGRSRAGAADLDGWRPAQEALLLAARAAGVQAIDGPHLGVAADAAFEAGARRAAATGFDGKWAIHPSQVEPLNAIFTPAEEELERARAIVAALDGADRGAVALDGEMLDEALRARALRTLARAGE
jgi:citrate lyase subunit beta/citryl-CoA lyase